MHHALRERSHPDHAAVARRRPARRIGVALALGAVLALPTAAGATLPGENGRIVFVSGRLSTDQQAQLFLLPVPGSTGGGTVSAAITSAAGQHRHPTWSPDRTKIAYARGDSATGNFDIYVLDVTTVGATPVNITNSNNVTDDRPAWSPDGSRIAFESEVTDGSGQTDVLIVPAPGGGAVTNLTSTAGAFEGKPAWTPDSQTLFYQSGNPNAPGNANIVRRSATGGAQTLAVADSGLSEFQPSISPDGTKVCFTLSNAGFNASADVLVAPITQPASGGLIVSKSIADGDYNCTFSPDGQFVAYVTGIFGAGQLVMVRADGTSLSPIELAQDAGANRFDGNPDWAPDGRPECPDVAVSTTKDKPVTFTVECLDTGPEYERSEVREFRGSSPSNGEVTQEFAGDPFTYTPAPGFTGVDAFQVKSFDALGFGSDIGIVTIRVAPPVRCNGRNATITGTANGETLVGTAGPDVIAGLGGDDVIRGLGDDDVICAGSGRDRVTAGAGDDVVNGEAGKDTLNGGTGRDRLNGGTGDDRASGGSGNDRLSGGAGKDTLSGGSGADRLSGGAGRDVCGGGPGLDRAAGCERRLSIP